MKKPKPKKPAYRVPTMAEMNAAPGNGYTVVSTFSGGGGSSTGYKMAGYRVALASEFVDAARDTYKANHPSTIVDPRDIREVTAEDILDQIGMKPGELDLFDGSPPCASFSTAGSREKGWGRVKKYSDKAQRSDDLFFEYARLIEGLQPKAFVAENVSGLIKGTAKGYFKQILARLRECGYVVEARLLDAQWLGVPQARQRLIFVGVRQDLCDEYGVAPAFPDPLPYRYTLRDAIPWMEAVVTHNPKSRFVGAKEPKRHDKVSPTIMAGGIGGFNRSQYHVEVDADMSRYSVGKEWQKLKPGEQSDKYFQLVRCNPSKPVGTITASGGNASTASVSHPYECRKFSIAELRRICSFPDDYVLTGSYAQQWERMGRSVPPVMMMHIAKTIQERVLDKVRG